MKSPNVRAAFLVLLGLTLTASVSFLDGCKKGSPVEPGPPVSDTTSHDIRWTTYTLGSFMSILQGIWGASPTSVWAVGSIDSSTYRLPSLVVHYDGQHWNMIQSDSLRFWIGAGFPVGIHGISDSCMALAGFNRDRVNGVDIWEGVVAFWDGHAWKNLRPNVPRVLRSVWVVSATDIYAGGEYGTLLHYDGHGWTNLPSPTTLHIQKLYGLPSGEIYAVACDESNSSTGSVILRLDGLNPRQEQAVEGLRMLALWGNQEVAYTTGEKTLRRPSGGSWGQVTPTMPYLTLHAAAGTKASDVILAGAFGSVVHWNGSSWRFYNELYSPSSSRIYYAALAVGRKYFVVGYNGFNAEVAIGER